MKVILLMRDGRAEGVLLDLGDGNEIALPRVLEVAPVYSNERRGRVRLELRAEIEHREAPPA